MANAAIFSKLSTILKNRSNTQNFQRILKEVRLVRTEDLRCVFEMEVKEKHQNREGVLHSGMISSLFDTMTFFALYTRSLLGVSIDLNINYLAPAKLGEKIIIDAQIIKIGKSLAFATVNLHEKELGKFIAHGKQTIYLLENYLQVGTDQPEL